MGTADGSRAYRCAPSAFGVDDCGRTSEDFLLASSFAQGDDGLCRQGGLGSASESEVGSRPWDFGGGAHVWERLEVQPSCSSFDDGVGVERGPMGAHSLFALCVVAQEVAVSSFDGGEEVLGEEPGG